MTTWNRWRRGVVALFLAVAVVASTGCQYVSEDVDEYPADMFNAPLDGPVFVTIPTWTGSVVGATVGAALLPLSWTAALFVDTWFPEVYSSEQDEEGVFVIHDGYDVAVMPMVGFGYMGGVLIGSPFYAVYFPYEVTKNVITGNERHPEGDVKLEFREAPIREERTEHPQNYPGG